MDTQTKVDNRIECRSYTHARRHPWVIGTIGGWHLPSPVTPTQLIVMLASFFGLLWTKDFWGFFGSFNLIINIGVPLGLSWVVRFVRVEGRSPVKFLIGWIQLQVSPRNGTYQGRPVFEGRAKKLNGSPLFMVDFEAAK